MADVAGIICAALFGGAMLYGIMRYRGGEECRIGAKLPPFFSEGRAWLWFATGVALALGGSSHTLQKR